MIMDDKNLATIVQKIVSPFSVMVNEKTDSSLDISFFGGLNLARYDLTVLGLQEIMEKISDEFHNVVTQTTPFLDLKSNHEFDHHTLRGNIEQLEAELIVKNAELEEMTKYKTFYDLYKGLHEK